MLRKIVTAHFEYASVFVKNLTSSDLSVSALSADIAASSPLAGKVMNCDQSGSNCDPAVLGNDVCKVGGTLTANGGECHIWYKVQSLIPAATGSVAVSVSAGPQGGSAKSLAHTFNLSFKNLLVAGGQSNGFAQQSGDGYLDVQWFSMEPIGISDFDGPVKS